MEYSKMRYIQQFYKILLFCQYINVATSLALSDAKEARDPAKNVTPLYKHLTI